MGNTDVVGISDTMRIVPSTVQCNVVFGTEIREIKQDDTLGKMLLVRPVKLNSFLQRYHIYVWYRYDISLAKNRLVWSFQLETTGRNKIKYPNMINKKQWKELEKERRKTYINTSYTKEVVPLEL